MKTSRPLAFLLMVIFAPAASAEQFKELKFNGASFTISPFLDEAWTDVPQNSTTVRATLMDNPVRMCWEFRLWNHLTSSPNLTGSLDVTAGTDIFASFYIYPNGHPMQPKSFYIYGTDVRNPNYSILNSTFSVSFRPAAPTISASYAGGYTAIGGIDFPYYGSGQVASWTPPIIAGTVIWDDISKMQHPSSSLLLGAVIRVNGVEGQAATMEFHLGDQYARWKKYDFTQSSGYLDGEVPSSGFSSVLGNPTTTVTTDVPNDSFKKLVVVNSRFSAHDIQAGVFLRFTNIVREAGGIRLHWNAQTTNRYTIQHFATLGGPTNILGTNLTGSGVLDPQSLTNPARFYRLRAQ